MNKEKKKDFILRLSAMIRTSVKSITGNLIGKYINTGRHRGGRNSKKNQNKGIIKLAQNKAVKPIDIRYWY